MSALLDSAKAELLAASDFPFAPGPGFASFNTPATFLKFNRELAARVHAYRASLAALPAGTYGNGGWSCTPCYDSVLADLNESLLDQGAPLDQRLLARVTDRPDTFSLNCLASALSWVRYPSPSSAVPIIRNEERILLDAEARWFTGDHTTARRSELHPPGVGGPRPDRAAATDAAFVSALLHERLYSLLYEGGAPLDRHVALQPARRGDH